MQSNPATYSKDKRYVYLHRLEDTGAKKAVCVFIQKGDSYTLPRTAQEGVIYVTRTCNTAGDTVEEPRYVQRAGDRLEQIDEELAKAMIEL